MLAGEVPEIIENRRDRSPFRLVDVYTILWESLDECLVQTDEVVDDAAFLPTGPEWFQAYNLPLLARRRRCYLHPEEKLDLSAVDYCCHVLVIDDGTRSLSACLLLLSTVDVDRDELGRLAERYGVERPVAELLRYLETDGDERAARLPTWDEFRALAAEYEVTIRERSSTPTTSARSWPGSTTDSPR